MVEKLEQRMVKLTLTEVGAMDLQAQAQSLCDGATGVKAEDSHLCYRETNTKHIQPESSTLHLDRLHLS